MCFPEKWVIFFLIPMTNKELDLPINLQEFYVFLGCIFFQASFKGISDRDQWWSTKAINMFEGAPHRLNNFMSRNQFNKIMSALRYTLKEVPILFMDCFHEVHDMINAFNNHYAQEYRPSWLSCLDESMNVWLNKFCPGFMVCIHKPNPFGNEYHSIANGDDGKFVMWRIKLVKGKDQPKLPNSQFAFPGEFEKKGYDKTVNLLLEMTKPLHGTGKVVTGDSGFCVTMGMIVLVKHGAHSQFLIKKRRFWPKGVPGDSLDSYMRRKEFGETMTYVQHVDKTCFLIHCCKD